MWIVQWLMMSYGGKKGREPWANTVVYYPFTSTTTNTDQSGNNHTLTTFSWITFETISSWLSVARFSWTSSWNSIKASCSNITMQNIWTISLFAKPEANWWQYPNRYCLFRQFPWEYIELYTARTWTYTARVKSNISCQSSIAPIVDWKRHHFVVVSTTTSLKLYIDSVLIKENTTSVSLQSWTATLYIWSNDDSYYWYNWLLSNVINEKTTRTETDITKYFNKMKNLYWIS